ncbi:thioredoxin-dependent thiol peroxidase [Holdemania massiliensis]|uniref:thioredoxin-dependent thiol peroxidase n=1 Tax=Holdemania massiliensis TaxID=1468449 RepID=UPI001F0511C1|nr:thioredoxin-dependent thiol peroxidase [Holdemania massiliensis]MCH1940105.1 thioredoxin-dependent thiol peroxidase [Holdemania massiliensis]
MEKAYDFTLNDSEGNAVSLHDFLGQKVVVYFYPKDSTPGCTKQACSYRDHFAELTARNLKVIGISKDSVTSHQKFIAKQNLNFTLLSDPDRIAIEAYGVWQEKMMYGKKVMGVARTTFVIDEQGMILKRFDKVKPDQDVAQVLALIDSLKAE